MLLPKPSRSAFAGSLCLLTASLLAYASPADAQATFASPQALVNAMLTQENANHGDHYLYTAEERSERTGGHLWTERIVEMPAGRLHWLVAEDGVLISPERVEQQRTTLRELAANPAEFARVEGEEKKAELHDREMLNMLSSAFLLDNVRLNNGTWLVDFHPNPDFSPSGMEAKVLHAMSGTLAIDSKDLRLTRIQASLPTDFSVGFGLLATIKAGSHFSSEREKIDGHWRTVHVLTDIRGKAALFKSVAKSSDVKRSHFQYLTADVNPVEAVALLEK